MDLSWSVYANPTWSFGVVGGVVEPHFYAESKSRHQKCQSATSPPPPPKKKQPKTTRLGNFEFCHFRTQEQKLESG